MSQVASYGMKKRLDVGYDEAIERVTAALQVEGFGVLTTIDVKATLKKKLDAEFRRYVILGACNPHIAHQALSAELDLGLLLPCNVIVYEDDTGSAVVSVVDPIQMLGVATNEELKPLGEEARVRLERVVAAL